jgi:hypothetical protein
MDTSAVEGKQKQRSVSPARARSLQTRTSNEKRDTGQLVLNAIREYAYGAKSPIGTFSDALMAEAKAKNWTVISMKADWAKIFPTEKK